MNLMKGSAKYIAALLLGGMLACSASAQPGEQHSANPDLRVTQVVVLMRHGIRSPARSQPMPQGIAVQAWPNWLVALGDLTPHGEQAIREIAKFDRSNFVAKQLLPENGCPAGDDLEVVADSDQRTIRTAEAYVDILAPGCEVDIHHKPQGQTDPLFFQIAAGAVPFDPEIALKAAEQAAGEGGIAGLSQRSDALLSRLDSILCGAAAKECGVARIPSHLGESRRGKRPQITGGLSLGSTIAQTLLLEYADGMALSRVGWGRATAADIAALSQLHAQGFAIVSRPAYIAARNVAGFSAIIRDAFFQPGKSGPKITLIAGHDNDIASFGGLLGVHWHVPGLAVDDPAPGSALIFEHLEGKAGQSYVRVVYRSQTLEQMRDLTPLGPEALPYDRILPVAGCRALATAGLCPEAQFLKMLSLPN